MEHQNIIKHEKYNYIVHKDLLKKIIKELPNNKCTGFRNIQNELFKNDLIIISDIIENIFTAMFNNGWVPDNFNNGKIVPIIKDINNRPITILDTLSNIYEKYMLIIINKKVQGKKQQLGFTKNSSTQHAIYITREAIKHNQHRGKTSRILGVDSKNAFDKTWRDGILNKLIKELENSEWRLLKYIMMNPLVI